MSNQPYYAADASQPVIVQGVSVPSNNKTSYSVSEYDHSTTEQPRPQYDMTTAISPPEMEGGEWTKGEPQPNRCNDVLFALLYLAHLGVMGYVAAKYVPLMEQSMIENYNGGGGGGGDGDGEGGGDERSLAAVSLSFLSDVGRRLEEGDQNYNYNNGGEDLDIDPKDLLFLIGVVGSLGFLVTVLALPFMMYCARGLIKFALVFNCVTTFLMGLIGTIAGLMAMALLGFLAFAFSAYYAYVVWARIPFAASNLKTAITAVRANFFGLAFFAYSSLLVLFGWTVWWSAAAISGLYAQMGCEGMECENDINGVLLFFFLLSFYWTHQVVKNHLHVTVAGTVGTWWFTPEEASHFCSVAVRDSFVRASTFSFGSICLGSLIVAVIQAMKELLNMIRQSGDDVLLCCAECILGCIESLAEYFNQWAFVFVGLYGYSFMEAGKNVISLFKTRGWTTIITDNLVDNVLLMVSAGIGILIGFLAIIVANIKQLYLPNALPFTIGFLIGFVLASVLMSIVGSAMNTVIVCYAEAPAEFQENHPKLSEEMRQSWRQAWPVDFQY